MAGWFEVSQAKDGQYRFVLKAGNGEPVLTSELYKTKASALNGIASVQKNSPDDANLGINSILITTSTSIPTISEYNTIFSFPNGTSI